MPQKSQQNEKEPLIEVWTKLRRKKKLTPNQILLHDIMLMCYNPFYKSELTEKQREKRRAKNKQARRARRINRLRNQ